MKNESLFVRQAVSGAEGDSAEVKRLFPVRNFMNFDPFVLWDDFAIRPGAGFPELREMPWVYLCPRVLVNPTCRRH